jgi:glyoxylase-like metal-dependent hydrolase (beta-lactamase superfamily II)
MIELSRRSLLTGTAAITAAAAAPSLPVQAAAPPTGKQAPGYYRYKVGEFEVTVVTDGAGSGALADTYVANASKAEVNAALAADFMPPDRVTGPYSPVVINTGSKLVAIDTGAVGQYHTNLQAAGIDGNAVDVVIISHFHGDHINGLVGRENKPAFPNAEVMVPAAECLPMSNAFSACSVIK